MPKACVLTGYGINCDGETEHALRSAGFETRRVHVQELVTKREKLDEHDLLALPGGFSFGDDLGSGKVLGNKMKFRLKNEVNKFVERGGLIIGICNGFQALVKMGLLPEPDWKQRTTLTFNESSRFEDRWVHLRLPESKCIFTRGIESMHLPIRHGEGKFIATEGTLGTLERNGQVVLQYCDPEGRSKGYPWNPNGSMRNVAGICDQTGRIFGLMPHPEAFNHVTNSPDGKREKGPLGIAIFRNAFRFCSQ